MKFNYYNFFFNIIPASTDTGEICEVDCNSVENILYFEFLLFSCEVLDVMRILIVDCLIYISFLIMLFLLYNLIIYFNNS